VQLLLCTDTQLQIAPDPAQGLQQAKASADSGEVVSLHTD